MTDQPWPGDACSLVDAFRRGERPPAEELDAFEAYLDRGGRVMYMGGNGFYWRTAVHGAAIELRRGRGSTATWKSPVGEDYSAFTGEIGGLWRDVGRATITAQAELGRLRADERLALFPDVRSDKLTRFTVGATFRQRTFGGIEPVTRLLVARKKS